MSDWELYVAGGYVVTDPRGTQLLPDVLYTFDPAPAAGGMNPVDVLNPPVGWNQFELEEPSQVTPLTLPVTGSFVGNNWQEP